MRGLSLRTKINLAIFAAFLAGALAFGAVLAGFLAERQAAARDRTRALLAVLAAHRLEALTPALSGRDAPEPARDILERLTRVEGVSGAALFDADGNLLAAAGERPVPPLAASPSAPLPSGRLFTVSSGEDSMTASLVEPVGRREGERLGFLRLRYSLADLHAFTRRAWVVFGVGLAGAYLFLATLLNVMLHRFVLRPVESLRRALEAVEAGGAGLVLPVVSRDALGRTVAAFNAMSARLRDSDRALDQSRAAIEEHQRLLARRVEERTAELALANQRLLGEIDARREAETSQERSLALHKAILESTAEAVVCIAGPPGHEILACNQRFLDLWDLPGDWPSQAGCDTRFQAMLDRMRDPETARRRGAELMQDARGIDVANVELRDGRCLERRSGPILQGDASLGRVFSYVDITERRQAEESLRQALAQLEQAKAAAEEASKAKGAFLAVMSHEIRTPLNAVMGLSEELLAGGAAADTREDYLGAIRDSAAHLLGVVDGILDFSKIEAGKLVFEKVDFEVRELVDGVARTLGPEARRKGLGFEVSVRDDVPRVLRGDPGRLRQVLLNLAGNAVKFTAAGRVSLAVEPESAPAAPDGRLGLLFRVTDTGIGMDASRLSGLFERYNQGSGAITRNYGGTGLGLAISKEIVERMGGHIAATSRKGEGSAFVFTARLEPSRTKTPRQPGKTAAPAPGARPQRILLVEDNALNATVFRLHMERMGHSLTVANSAREAYSLLARDRFDAVLMDIEMPEIDGITAARTIRAGGLPAAPALDPGVPIIAVTAHAVEDVRQQCQDAGMDGFVTKPVNYGLLQGLLEAGTRGRVQEPATAPAGPSGEPPLFDPDGARQAMAITWEQYEGLVQVSFAEGTRRLEDARRTIDEANARDAALAVHSFKGAAATLGAMSCRQLAVTLEAAVRRGDLKEGRNLCARLCSLWEKVARALEARGGPAGVS